MSTEPFKRCSLCGWSWATRADFLGDPEVRLIGYQAFTEDVAQGFLLFNHRCGTTLALEVLNFQDLHEGVVYSERLAGTPACPQRCFDEKDLEPCPNRCAGAWVRDVLQRVRHWPKRPPEPLAAAR